MGEVEFLMRETTGEYTIQILAITSDYSDSGGLLKTIISPKNHTSRTTIADFMRVKHSIYI
jgi:hypothetical protein